LNEILDFDGFVEFILHSLNSSFISSCDEFAFFSTADEFIANRSKTLASVYCKNSFVKSVELAFRERNGLTWTLNYSSLFDLG